MSNDLKVGRVKVWDECLIEISVRMEKVSETRLKLY